MQLTTGNVSTRSRVPHTPPHLTTPAKNTAGDVDAPIAVPIVAAAVVTIAITFAVPAYLNRGRKGGVPLWRVCGCVPPRQPQLAGRVESRRVSLVLA